MTETFLSCIRWQDVKNLFRQEVGPVSRVELSKDQSGNFRGCGLVEFETGSAAVEAVERMNRFEWKGRSLVVRKGELGNLVEDTSMEAANPIGKPGLVIWPLDND